MDLEKEIKIEYDRLHRHVRDLTPQWSEHVMRDLSTCLRNWVQLSKHIDGLSWQLKFPHYSKTKSRKKMEQPGSESDVFPGGLKQGGVSTKMSVAHNRVLSPEEIKKSVESEKFNQVRDKIQSFSNWLGVEEHELKIMVDGKPRRVGIARNVFIERCANILGGAHPINSDRITAKEVKEVKEFKDIDNYIVRLMNSQIIEVPVPYAHLLSYGQTILKTFKQFS